MPRKERPGCASTTPRRSFGQPSSPNTGSSIQPVIGSEAGAPHDVRDVERRPIGQQRPIVDSTLTATGVGDAAWKQVLAEHNRLIRAQLERFRGREVNTTGDGFLATFGSAAGALRSALATRDAIRGLGIELRIGVHTGEVDVLPNDIGGVAVHAAARIMALGGASEIIVSSVTRGLVEGSGFRFSERGQHQVKGLERPIEVFLLET
jgi:class 3 adenylate cyclase